MRTCHHADGAEPPEMMAHSARAARLTLQRIATNIGSPELNDSLIIRRNRWSLPLF
jgi:hypothetical protein